MRREEFIDRASAALNDLEEQIEKRVGSLECDLTSITIRSNAGSKDWPEDVTAVCVLKMHVVGSSNARANRPQKGF